MNVIMRTNLFKHTFAKSSPSLRLRVRQCHQTLRLGSTQMNNRGEDMLGCTASGCAHCQTSLAAGKRLRVGVGLAACCRSRPSLPQLRRVGMGHGSPSCSMSESTRASVTIMTTTSESRSTGRHTVFAKTEAGGRPCV